MFSCVLLLLHFIVALLGKILAFGFSSICLFWGVLIRFLVALTFNAAGAHSSFTALSSVIIFFFFCQLLRFTDGRKTRANVSLLTRPVM